MKYDLKKQSDYRLFSSYMNGNKFFVCDLQSVELFPMVSKILKLKQFDDRIITFDSAEFGTYCFDKGFWIYDVLEQPFIQTNLFWKHDFYVKRVNEEWGVYDLVGELIGEGKNFAINFTPVKSMRYSDFLVKLDEWKHDKNYME